MTARDAAEAYAESCDNESGRFLTRQLEAIRKAAFLAGNTWALEHDERAKLLASVRWSGVG